MKILLDAQEIAFAIDKIAGEIIEDFQGGMACVPPIQKGFALIGIRTRGVFLAERVKKRVEEIAKVSLPLGILDITLYRDDLSRLSDHPLVKKTEIPFSIESKILYLIDDVLFTGRTIRCALDALFDLGRPESVRLAVMVDRGGRELPIQADVVGIHYEAVSNQNVKVQLKELDNKEMVEVYETHS